MSTPLERAESAMREAQQELKEAKARFTVGWKEDNGEELTRKYDQEFETNALLKRLNDNLAQFVKLYNDLVNQQEAIYLEEKKGQQQGGNDTDAMKSAFAQLNEKIDILIPFIADIKLEQFALVATTDKTNNRLLKIDFFNYYNQKKITQLPSVLTCNFIGVPLPTNEVICAHVFQKRWAPSRRIISLSEVNDPSNLILLHKPIEIIFDEGRICFVWNESSKKFEMKILDPKIRTKTIAELAIKQFPAFTNADPIFLKTLASLEGRPLDTGVARMPYKRCFSFHAARARYEAIHIHKWITKEDFIIPDDAWSPNILEKPELKSYMEAWLNAVEED